MIHIDRMYISPVKGLALMEVRSALLDKPGIAGDRAFYLIDGEGRLFTQREYGPLVRITPAYAASTGELTLRFPDGAEVKGVPEPGEPVSTSFFAIQRVDGHVVRGDWNDALSAFAGQPVRLVKVDRAGAAFDGFPISMCSNASLEAFAAAAGRAGDDGRRFRQNLYLAGTTAHQEDEWLDREVRVGRALLRVKMRDSRCVITTHSPDTGEAELDSLKIIAPYRTEQPKEVNFGVYCTVAEPGEAAAGDEVSPVS